MSDEDVLAQIEVAEGWTTIHRCPPGDSGLMPCCGRTPFEVPRSDRMTLDDSKVSCGASRLLGKERTE